MNEPTEPLLRVSTEKRNNMTDTISVVGGEFQMSAQVGTERALRFSCKLEDLFALLLESGYDVRKAEHVSEAKEDQKR